MFQVCRSPGDRKPFNNIGRLPPGTFICYLGSPDTLIGRALHQHKLHFTDVYGFRRDHAGRIFLKNDGFVFHKGE